MNSSNPCAEAVAIKDNRIFKVGSTEEVSYLIGKNTKIVSLEGGTVLPGLIDTHVHIADFGRFLMWMDLTPAGSINKMQVMLSDRLEKTPQGRWVVGRGWNENRFIERRLPSRLDLDIISPHNPVIFYHQNGQIAVVNSLALKLAGITGQTAAPVGGIIEVDVKTNEPTGVLRETATDLVWKLVPEPSIEELADSAKLACEKIVQAGITGVHWLAESAVDVDILKKLLSTCDLPFDVYLVIPLSLLGDGSLLEGLNGGAARLGAVELIADGYLASRTAALFEPYVEEPKNRGSLQCTKNDLANAINNISTKGFQVVIHAMGDKAVDLAVNAFTATDAKGRHRIDPAALLSPTIIQSMKGQKIVVSVQPLVAASEFAVYDAIDHLGEERARWLYPLKTLMSQGVHVCGGSDCPMEPLSPLLGIQSILTRRFFPEEQLSVDEALEMYTANAAWASCEEKEKGSIEEGKIANLTVLSEDPHAVSQNKIQDITVEMTIINGKISYTRSN